MAVKEIEVQQVKHETVIKYEINADGKVTTLITSITHREVKCTSTPTYFFQ
jgi:hypothetical protein